MRNKSDLKQCKSLVHDIFKMKTNISMAIAQTQNLWGRVGVGEKLEQGRQGPKIVGQKSQNFLLKCHLKPNPLKSCMRC